MIPHRTKVANSALLSYDSLQNLCPPRARLPTTRSFNLSERQSALCLLSLPQRFFSDTSDPPSTASFTLSSRSSNYLKRHFAPEARIKSRSKPAFHVQDVLKRDVSSYHGGGCARRSVRIRDTARDIFDVVFQYIYLAFADFSDGFSKTSCLLPLCPLRDHRTRRSSSCDNPHDALSGRACAAHHHCCRRQLRSIFSLMAFGQRVSPKSRKT